MTRRQLLGGVALAGASYWVAPRGTRAAEKAGAVSANEKLDIAVIGIGGRGRANLNGVAKLKDEANIVALCDVDDKRAGDAYRKFPKAEKFYDYRHMFDKMGKSIDGVVISTPDHAHFHPSMVSLQLGKHLYCEKPMAHSVWQSRQMTRLAREKKVATQLGVQRHTIPNMHRVVEIVQSGALGEVKECHAWVGGNRGMPKAPKDYPPVPPHLRWYLWLGQAQDVPYSPAIAPYNWRFWWDYGTGETGNWGCHVLDIPYWALKLQYPNRVSASGPEVHDKGTPRQMATSFRFPKRGDLSEVMLHWYHAKKGPPVLKERGIPHVGTGALFIGSKYILQAEFGKRRLFSLDGKPLDLKELGDIARTVPDSPGFYREWINACKGGEAATCNFDYSGPMAETVLLGNAAYRAGGEAFDWDAEKLEAKGNDKVKPFLSSYTRKGWEIG
ncbi:MAG: Gfo/Idh/MocA family oxidoreductase [Planctomycetota bacterium]